MIFDFQSRYHATIWKNGIAQFLNDGEFPQTANSVFVAGNYVYAAGISGNAATAWDNGQAINLGTGVANSVFVSGSNVYVAGTLESAATLWKNGVVFNLQGLTEASSVFVK